MTFRFNVQSFQVFFPLSFSFGDRGVAPAGLLWWASLEDVKTPPPAFLCSLALVRRVS